MAEAAGFILIANFFLKIILFWSLMISTTSTEDGILSQREIIYKTSKMAGSKEMLCSTATPMMISNKVRSRIECTLLCRDDPRCESVNWRAPNTCELLEWPVAAFKAVEGCTFMSEDIIAYNY